MSLSTKSLSVQVGEELASLRIRPHASDVEVHNARKRLKKLRAGLRLLRASMGRTCYRHRNIQLRDAGQMLNPIRDAKSLRKTAETLRKRDDRRRVSRFLENLERTLDKERTGLRQDLNQALARRFAHRLTVASKAAPAKLMEPELQSCAVALERAFRNARRSLKRLARGSPDDCWHEWRKEIKYLLNETELLGPLYGTSLKKLIQGAHELSDLLGEDHDLVLLESKLRALSLTVPGSVRQRIRHRHKHLRDNALATGERVFDRRPRRFAASVLRKLMNR